MRNILHIMLQPVGWCLHVLGVQQNTPIHASLQKCDHNPDWTPSHQK